jgi:hypothetical protein
VKLITCKEGVGGVHSTDDVTDNKTVIREGTLLYSRILEEVRASECPKG